MRFFASLLCLLWTAVAYCVLVGPPHWYYRTPSPTDDELRAYQVVHTTITNAHSIGSFGRPFQLPYIEYARLQYEPFEFRNRVVRSPRQNLALFVAGIRWLIPTVRSEMQVPLQPSLIRHQSYGALHQRYLYYTHIMNIAQANRIELMRMPQPPAYRELFQDLELNRQSQRLLQMVMQWHLPE